MFIACELDSPFVVSNVEGAVFGLNLRDFHRAHDKYQNMLMDAIPKIHIIYIYRLFHSQLVCSNFCSRLRRNSAACASSTTGSVAFRSTVGSITFLLDVDACVASSLVAVELDGVSDELSAVAEVAGVSTDAADSLLLTASLLVALGAAVSSATVADASGFVVVALTPEVLLLVDGCDVASVVGMVGGGNLAEITVYCVVRASAASTNNWMFRNS